MPVTINRGRRRRVILDEAVQSELPEHDTTGSHISCHLTNEPAAPEYSEAARRRFQLRTTDLIPKRALSLIAVISLLLSGLFGIVILDQCAANWEPVIGKEGVRAFSIGMPASLGTWFSASLLLLTAIASLQVYVLRQHRRDDYRGVYRWWLWLAVILVLASLNNVAGLISIAANAAGQWFHSNAPFATGWGWSLVKLGALLVLLGRFAYEMRISRVAASACMVILMAYSGAILIEAVPMAAQWGARYMVSFGSLILLGQIAVFGAVLGYSRYIYLDAHGLIKSKSPTRGSKSKNTTRLANVASRFRQMSKLPNWKFTRTQRSTQTRRSKPTRKRAAKRDPDNQGNSKKTNQQRPQPSKEQVTGESKSDEANSAKSRAEKRASKSPGKSAPAPSISAESKLTTPLSNKNSRNKSRSQAEKSQIELEIESLQGKQLSKSERRRLKKLKRRQQQAA